VGRGREEDDWQMRIGKGGGRKGENMPYKERVTGKKQQD